MEWGRRIILALASLVQGSYHWLSDEKRGRTSNRSSPAEVLLVLGGSETRELACAALHSGEALLVLSSGAATPEECAAAAGIDLRRVVVDRRAVCTVTNFTSIVTDLEKAGCRSVVITTSPSHMRRAFLVGCVCLGSRGIRCERRCCRDDDDPEGPRQESTLRVLRDLLRSALWLLAGWDGGGVAGWWYPYRGRAAREAKGLDLGAALQARR